MKCHWLKILAPMIRSSYPTANRPDGACHWVPGKELVEHPDELLGGALRRQRREAADVGEQNAENVKFFTLKNYF